MFKVNNEDARTTPGVVLVSLLLNLNIFTPSSNVSIVNLEHVIAGWVYTSFNLVTFLNKFLFVGSCLYFLEEQEHYLEFDRLKIIDFLIR